MKNGILVFIVAFAIMPIKIVFAETVEEGTCGTNCYYKIEGDLLTISGTGAINDYGQGCDGNGCYTLAPWAKKSVKNVIIEEGISRVGKSAFYNTKIESVTLPKTLKEIGSTAFERTYISSIDLPEGLEKIENSAFNTTKISELYLPETVTSIGNVAFGRDQDLYHYPEYKVLEKLYCAKNNQELCLDSLENSGLTNTQLKTYTKTSLGYFMDNKQYSSVIKMINNTPMKRIYTLEEANAVAKPTGNTVRIKYR